MFVSPCSLRSTQCAALIALAAAAGIVRVESNSHKSTTSQQTEVDPRPIPVQPRAFEILLHAPAAWPARTAGLATCWSGNFPLLSTLTEAFLTHSGGDSVPIDFISASSAAAAKSLPSVPFLHRTSDRPALCCRPHVLPFAVGPPRSHRTSTLNADGTPVPGDSAANRTSAPKVAAQDEVSSDARLARPCSPSQTRAESVSRFGFALRGEPLVQSLALPPAGSAFRDATTKPPHSHEHTHR